MNKWKEELKQAFEAPQPVKKREFLRQLELFKIPVHTFLISQIGYIRKRVWCISVVCFIASILGYAIVPDTVIWLISGLTPLLALTIISESGRSELHRMAEMEMATRFSLRSVTLARLVVIGLMNLLLLIVFILISSWNDPFSLLAVAVYIFTPFLLSSFTGLYIMRKFRGQEAMYACVGTSVGISMFLFFSHDIFPYIYQEQCFAAWMIIALILLYGNGKQCIAMINQTEELAWNLS